MKGLEVLVGKVIVCLEGLEAESEEVYIKTMCGGVYKFYHEQDCCETVDLYDFELDADLTGGRIISAEEITGEGVPGAEEDESNTWTFYKVETDKGGLWMRWLGMSNGYYSESVEFEVVKVSDDG